MNQIQSRQNISKLDSTFNVETTGKISDWKLKHICLSCTNMAEQLTL